MSKSKSKKAVALKYNMDKDMSPVVIASGYGEIAERIIDIAEQKGIPVFRDDSAASLMCMLDVGSNIPPQLYEIIAVIYGQIMKTSAEIKNKEEKPSDTDSLSDRHSNFLKKRSALGQETEDLPQPEQTQSGQPQPEQPQLEQTQSGQPQPEHTQSEQPKPRKLKLNSDNYYNE